MAKVSVVARIPAAPGKRDELAQALQALLDSAEGEPGTLLYLLNADGADEDVLWMYELYASQEALDTHMASPTFQSLGPVIGPFLAGRPELHFGAPLGGKGL